MRWLASIRRGDPRRRPTRAGEGPRLLIASNRLPISVRGRAGRLHLVTSNGGFATYYDGFSNGVIWPLFHHLLDRVPIDSGHWAAYQRVKAFRRELDELIGRINGRFGTVDAVPIHYLYRSVPPHELAALYRAADVMVVTPLRDGMNLVAKEFVAALTTTATGLDPLAALEDGRMRLPSPVTLLVDYDGTLVPIAQSPGDARPDPDLLGLLTALAAHPQIDLHLVTGRSMETVERWFGQVPASLWAEHGAACRKSAGPWERVVAAEREWMEQVSLWLADVCAHSPGSLIERKTTSLAWHYRMVDPSLAALQLQHLHAALPGLLGDLPVDVIEGKMVVEFRPRGVSKALVVGRLAGGDARHGSMVAIGDDRTDEEMFGVMPSWGVAIRVGDGGSRAAWRLPNSLAVRRFLARILATRSDGRSTRPRGIRPAQPRAVIEAPMASR